MWVGLLVVGLSVKLFRISCLVEWIRGYLPVEKRTDVMLFAGQSLEVGVFHMWNEDTQAMLAVRRLKWTSYANCGLLRFLRMEHSLYIDNINTKEITWIVVTSQSFYLLWLLFLCYVSLAFFFMCTMLLLKLKPAILRPPKKKASHSSFSIGMLRWISLLFCTKWIGIW